MNGFDWAVVAVLALSVLTGYARGVVRSLVGLVAWVAGLLGAIAFTPVLGGALARIVDHPFLPYLVAFVLVFVVALVLGALVAWPLRAVVAAAGLGFVDRGLGAAFGALRGAALVLAAVLLVGIGGLSAADWWQNSRLAPALAQVALDLRPWLPRSWAERLDFTGRAVPPGRVAPAMKEG